MSEHQELIAILSNVLMEQRRTTEAVTQLAEAIAGIKRPEPVAEPEVSTPAPEVNNPTNPAHAVKQTPTADDLKAALMLYKKATSAADAKAMLKEFDAAKLSDVKESDRQAMIDKMVDVV